MKVGKDFKWGCSQELSSTDGGGLWKFLVFVVRTQFMYISYAVTGNVTAFLAI